MKSEIPLIETDTDLIALLKAGSDQDLEPLVKYVLGGQDEDAFRISSELELTESFKKNGQTKRHSAYAVELAAEIQKFGGNTFANMWRGGKGVPYREIVVNVASRLKVNFNENQSVEEIELQILMRVLEKAYEKMSDLEREALLKELGQKHSKTIPNAFPIAGVQAAIKIGGFAAYEIAVIVANAAAKAMLGRGLSIAGNAALTKAIGVFAGPVGWTINGLWLAYDLAGPAYRVTIPCVIHCAFLRQAQKIAACPNGHTVAKGTNFCPNCGEKMKGKRQ